MTESDLSARMDRIEQKLDRLLATRSARPPDDLVSKRQLLTKREAARILRCSRSGTLEAAIRSGRIETVPAVGGRGLRIPRDEIERVMREGFTPLAPATPTRKPRVRTASRKIPEKEFEARVRAAVKIPRFDD